MWELVFGIQCFGVSMLMLVCGSMWVGVGMWESVFGSQCVGFSVWELMCGS